MGTDQFQEILSSDRLILFFIVVDHSRLLLGIRVNGDLHSGTILLIRVGVISRATSGKSISLRTLGIVRVKAGENYIGSK